MAIRICAVTVTKPKGMDITEGIQVYRWLAAERRLWIVAMTAGTVEFEPAGHLLRRALHSHRGKIATPTSCAVRGMTGSNAPAPRPPARR